MPPKITDSRPNPDAVHTVEEQTASGARKVVATYSENLGDGVTLMCMLGIEPQGLVYKQFAEDYEAELEQSGSGAVDDSDGGDGTATKKATKKSAKKTTKKAAKKAAKKSAKKGAKKSTKKTTKTAKKTTKKAAKKTAKKTKKTTKKTATSSGSDS
nr:adenylate kinase [Streptococcus thermophilus]